MRFINTLIAAVVAVLVVLFAVSNRGVVIVELWPFPISVEAGLYAVILFAVALGFVAGLIGAWMGGRQTRKELRAGRKRMRDLEQSLTRAKDDAAAARAKAELASASKP